MKWILCVALGALLSMNALAGPGKGDGEGGGKVSGSALQATATAVPIWSREMKYSWTLQKEAFENEARIPKHHDRDIHYVITAIRSEPSVSDTVGVQGQLCVENVGELATEALKLDVRTQILDGDDWGDLEGASQELVPPAQLGPGDSKCYAYRIVFPDAVPAAAHFRIRAEVSDRCNGGGGDADARADFVFPGVPTQVFEIGKSAHVQDAVACPQGMSCTASASQWSFDGSGSVPLTVNVKNHHACRKPETLGDVATLIESNSTAHLQASASVTIDTGHCCWL